MKHSTAECDFREMFYVACSFTDTAERAVGDKTIEKEGWMRQNIIPEIVNRAFACEIFLKAMLTYKNIKFKRNHNLFELWKKLSKELSNKVEGEIYECIELEESVSLDDLINKIANAFNEWRYIYEENLKSVNLGFLKIFNDSLREVCCKEIHGNTWTTYKELR